MNVLVIGSGGREHALAWKIARDARVETVWVAPGNAGTARDPELRNLAITTDEIPTFVVERSVDLVVVGPEAPLVAGLADTLRAHGVRVVGPGADGALLEGSKAFAKEIMVAANVPTARYVRATSREEIDAFVDAFDGDALVVKADGLAAGKGVIVCDDKESARRAAHAMLDERTFGDASDVIVLEERLHGIETSYIVLTDGERYVAMPTSQDHKRLLDGDLGPNTGGMGAFSPAPFVDDATRRRIEEEVIEPTLQELRRRGIDFRGFLYAGVMLTPQGPSVLEFNVRLGDPETQALMVALGDGLVDALVGAAEGNLQVERFEGTGAAAVVVLAAEGYPASPAKGAAIEGLDAAATVPDVVVFHAGTAERDGEVVVSGGRVLGVTARGTTPDDAVRRAYEAVAHITWPGMQLRRDIGKALRSE
jgi:phosphoribosylamine--glycine ligase